MVWGGGVIGSVTGDPPERPTSSGAEAASAPLIDTGYAYAAMSRLIGPLSLFFGS